MNPLTLSIDLSVLSRNIIKIKNNSNPSKFLLPVKANAYGHGIIPVAQYAEKNDLVDYFGVAHLCEALELRDHGITKNILVMSPSVISEEHLFLAAENNVEISISDSKTLQKALNIKGLKIHISIDTGMGREGFFHSETTALLKNLSHQNIVQLVGVMSHFAVSDELDESSVL